MSRARRWASLAAALGLVALIVGQAAASGEGETKTEPMSLPPLPETPHVIADMLIDLQRIQLRMAAGEKNAYALQTEELKTMGEAIAAAKPEIWKYKSETDAVAAYTLSGGNPRIVAKLLETGAIPSSEDHLVRGSLAYAIGRERDAETLLADIDPRAANLRLGAQLAYAKSVLATTRRPETAIELLDLARLLAPGSLVEEAALRREILVLGDRHEGDRVLFLARQYVSRFPNSIYADSFIQGLAAAAIRYRLIDDMVGLRKFEVLLTLVKPGQRRQFLLTTSRIQTINGNNEVAGGAASDALADMPADSKDAPRARFYLAANKFIGDDYLAGLAELKSLDRSQLSPDDQALSQAALYVASHLRDEPSARDFNEADREYRLAKARSPDLVEPNPNDPTGILIQRAQTALDEVDALIQHGRSLP